MNGIINDYSIKNSSLPTLATSMANSSRSSSRFNTRLNGDFATSFERLLSSENETHASPRGAAANQANNSISMAKTDAGKRTIDKTSELYEKSLEMESYFVKMMISQMRKTVVKADGEKSFAENMYEDMLYDEYSTAMTKNAGFGLADQIYLQLSQKVDIEA